MAEPSPKEASDILAIYTRDVARHPLLTPEEEKELGLKAKKGDLDAQEKLVLHNLRFVITQAKKYLQTGIPMMDLIQAGNMGLAHAAKKFDPSRNVRFISYAVYWIVQAIQKEIDASNGSVRATQTQMVRLRRVKRLQSTARQELGRDLSIEEISKRTGYTAARVEEAMDYRVNMKSLEDPVGQGGDGGTVTLAHILGAEDTRGQNEEEQERKTVVAQIMNEVLSERERLVLQEYFGFQNGRELSLTEIGYVRNISRERVRQLKERALKKLRAAKDRYPDLKEIFTTHEEMEKRAGAGTKKRVISAKSKTKSKKIVVTEDEEE